MPFTILPSPARIPDMETTTLSEAAVALFRLHVERNGSIEVDDSNREPYREMERAGLVLPGRPFTGEPRYHLTRQGFEMRIKLFGCAKEIA